MGKNTKTIEEKYKSLTPEEHVLHRPGTYIGSTVTEDVDMFILDDGRFVKKTVKYNPGFIKLFDEIISNSVDESKRSGSKLDSIKVEKTAKGLMLTIENLRFKPDSAELLPGEEMRLMKIAEILRNVPKSMFLVEGHTASTGNISGEQRLSEERAKSIAMSLAITALRTAERIEIKNKECVAKSYPDFFKDMAVKLRDIERLNKTAAQELLENNR